MVALDFPDAPTAGQVFDKWTWNGTVWVLTTRGELGSAQRTTSGAFASGAWVDVGVEVTFTAVAGRRYSVVYNAGITVAGSPQDAFSGFWLDTTQITAVGGSLIVGTHYLSGSWRGTFPAGSHIGKLRVYVAAGTGHNFTAAPALPAILSIEDITP